MSHFKENMNELVGRYYGTEEFVDYKADVEAPLPMIYQSGYLTIKDWDMDTDSYLLDFPNDEVRRGFVALLAFNYFKTGESTDAWIIQVVKTMKAGDCNALEKLLTSFLASIPYSQRRKDDEREKEQSEGRVDCVVETPLYVYIFEFKRDGDALSALQQIEDKGYAREYLSDSRKIYQIGCNFSSETGTVDGWKVK